MTERRAHRDVDEVLAAAGRDAASAQLPAALRARILGATRPAAAPPPRGRLLDLALRAAAVAAAFGAVLFVMPASLAAAEFDAAPLVAWHERITSSVAGTLPHIDLDGASVADAASSSALPFAAAGAVLLVGAGLWLVRRSR